MPTKQHISTLPDQDYKFIARGVTIAFPDLAVPRAFKNDPKNTPRFACHILFPKEDAASLKVIKDALAKLGKDELKTDRVPMADTFLRDGDESRQEAYQGHWVLSLYRYPNPNGKNNGAPDVVDMSKQRLNPGDQGYPYSGSVCNVVFDAYVAKKWKKISGGFSAVQFVADGPVIGGASDISYLDGGDTDDLD